MFYKVNENNEIIETCIENYDGKFLETDKNIVVGFDGKLYFEEDTRTNKYLTREYEYKLLLDNNKKIAEYKLELEELTKDLAQVQAGLVIDNIEEKKERFRYLLNEVRFLQGKEPREVKE